MDVGAELVEEVMDAQLKSHCRYLQGGTLLAIRVDPFDRVTSFYEVLCVDFTGQFMSLPFSLREYRTDSDA